MEHIDELWKGEVHILRHDPLDDALQRTTEELSQRHADPVVEFDGWYHQAIQNQTASEVQQTTQRTSCLSLSSLNHQIHDIASQTSSLDFAVTQKTPASLPIWHGNTCFANTCESLEDKTLLQGPAIWPSGEENFDPFDLA